MTMDGMLGRMNEPRVTLQINLRVSPDEKAQIKAGATAVGVSVHRFIVDSALYMAENYAEPAER